MPCANKVIQEVAVGVILQEQNILLGQRRPEQSYAGFWELPGGKCDAGEQVAETLARELWEELGIQVTAVQSLWCLQHEYPEQIIRLHIDQVLAYTGEPQGIEGQKLAWVSLSEAKFWRLLPANHVIIEVLTAIIR